MFERRILPVWLGLVLLSIVFLLGCPSTDDCTDNDGDGYGDPSSTACTYYGLDCDDADPDIHPGAVEASYGDPVCSDGLDNDCDGLVDDDDPGCQVCLDDDGDGYGDPGSDACAYPGLDCDDADAGVNPGADEDCDNGIDDDCDGLVDGDDPACGGALLVPDTDQSVCYDDADEIACPAVGAAFYGQDAQYEGPQLSYIDHGDGTVTDLNTGLMWQQSPDTDNDGDIDAADKLSYDVAAAGACTFSLGGYADWRLPTIKELYSLIAFSGIDPSGYDGTDTSGLVPFIDTEYFDFAYGDTSAGERIIDSQYASDNLYVGDGGNTLFGVNFADGRIKGYGLELFCRDKTFFVIYVRGNTGYGTNAFTDNGDGTVSDGSTGLMWTRDDSGTGLNWEEALAWVAQKNSEVYLGHNDWSLPNAKELQSIVDYTRSPDSTGSAAIDPVFNTTAITKRRFVIINKINGFLVHL
jgi:hypothetical protein